MGLNFKELDFKGTKLKKCIFPTVMKPKIKEQMEYYFNFNKLMCLVYYSYIKVCEKVCALDKIIFPHWSGHKFVKFRMTQAPEISQFWWTLPR